MDIVNKINKLLVEKGEVWKDKVKHPGILEIGEDGVMSKSPDYFIKLAKTKGKAPVVRALMNLYRWNKSKNPKLSKWAKDTQEKVSAAL